MTRTSLYEYFNQMADADGRVTATPDWLADTAEMIANEAKKDGVPNPYIHDLELPDNEATVHTARTHILGEIMKTTSPEMLATLAGAYRSLAD